MAPASPPRPPSVPLPRSARSPPDAQEEGLLDSAEVSQAARPPRNAPAAPSLHRRPSFPEDRFVSDALSRFPALRDVPVALVTKLAELPHPAKAFGSHRHRLWEERRVTERVSLLQAMRDFLAHPDEEQRAWWAWALRGHRTISAARTFPELFGRGAGGGAAGPSGAGAGGEEAGEGAGAGERAGAPGPSGDEAAAEGHRRLLELVEGLRPSDVQPPSCSPILLRRAEGPGPEELKTIWYVQALEEDTLEDALVAQVMLHGANRAERVPAQAFARGAARGGGERRGAGAGAGEEAGAAAEAEAPAAPSPA